MEGAPGFCWGKRGILGRKLQVEFSIYAQNLADGDRPSSGESDNAEKSLRVSPPPFSQRCKTLCGFRGTESEKRGAAKTG